MPDKPMREGALNDKPKAIRRQIRLYKRIAYDRLINDEE